MNGRVLNNAFNTGVGITREFRSAAAMETARMTPGAGARKTRLKELSLHPEPSPFASAELYTGRGGVNSITPGDVLHTLGSNGIVSKLLFCAQLLGDGAVIDDRIGRIPRAKDSAEERGW